MPTLRIEKSPATGQEAEGRQLHLSLPRVRVPVQPAQAFRAAYATYRDEAGLLRWRSLGDGYHLADSSALTHPCTHSEPPARPVGSPSPVAFAREVLGVTLWEKQEEVLTALTTNRRVAVKAGNGLGKGFCAAVAVLWYMHAHQDSAIVLTTAPTFRQVRHILWRQIRRLYRPAAGALEGKMLDTRWDLSDGRYALGLSADGADQFQGFHSPNMFIVVDEAEGVSDDIYEAIESVMTSDEPLLLLIGNPTTMTGAFRRAFHEERRIYHPITISAFDSPNVRAGRVVMPGLTTSAWVEERREIWSEDSAVYRARVLGQFPEQEDNTLLKLSDIEAAADRNPPGADGVSSVVLAVDVARFGSDRSVILRRRGNRVEEIQALRQMDTMQLAGRVAAAIRDCGPSDVYIDEVGVGAGVVDRLHELGHPVRGINVGRRSRRPETYANLRAEAYWTLAERFRSGNISIPDDNELVSELAALRYYYDRNSHVKIECKDEMRKRGLRSPDKADALMLAFLAQGHGTRLWT